MYKKVFFTMLHLLFWGLSIYIITRIFGISTVEIFAESTGNGDEEVIIRYDDNFISATITTVVLSAFIFYTNIFLFLKKYFKDKKANRYLVKIITLIVFVVLIDIVINKHVNYADFRIKETFPFPSFALHMSLLLFYIAFSYAYAFTSEYYKNEKLRNEISKEKLKTELNFLKSQINPHFLFNTLNNLFSISQKHNIDELSTGINELSNLMRYMLYESNADYVSLKKELDYIESFIEIQQLRHDEEDELIINFEKKGDLSSAVIAPMILLPFVENAFKHGFSLNDSSVINFTLEASPSNISFKAKNKAFKLHKFSDKTSGIGLENVTRRLNLIYPDRHTLKIFEKNGYFFIELNIMTNG